ncbi:MAG: hypothetical protein KDB54_00490 [Solirubrobacterales bacterium]|nr:hypothetical protein [Solirubrobacterales bacterium]MCB0859116.1 hypothetical protein [Solirubrobacterales bacterium]
MRSRRKPDKTPRSGPAPEDTQEMFAAGQALPGEADEETREYEVEDPGEVLEEEEAVVEEHEAAGEEEIIEDGDLAEDDGAIEEENWDEEDFEDWDEEPDESADGEAGAGEGESGDEGEEKTRGDDLKVWFGDFGQRVKSIWSGAWSRVGSIRLPSHEIDGQKALAVAGIIAVALMVGAGGYLVGKGTGDDVDQARLEGEFAGKRAGAIAGATKGYAAGFKKGRDVAFRKSYSASYRRNYIRAYDNAGMDAPKAKDIEVPEP